MYLILAVLLFIAWALCFLIFQITAVLIHLLLIFAILAVILHFARGGGIT